MNVAFKQPARTSAFARFDRRGAAVADRHRRRLRAHRHLRAGRRRPHCADFALSRAGHRSVAVSAGDEPPAIGEIRLPEKLSAFSRLRELPCRRRGRSSRQRRALRSRRGLDVGSGGRRPRAQPGRLLSGLSVGREPRPCAGRRIFVRRRLRLLPARAVENARPAAIVPHARICLHRHARADRGVSRALDEARGELRRPIGACPIASIRPAIRSSAAAAS